MAKSPPVGELEFFLRASYEAGLGQKLITFKDVSSILNVP
jgi:hypothetical protein